MTGANLFQTILGESEKYQTKGNVGSHGGVH